MNVEILDSGQRWLLAGLFAVFAVGAILLRRYTRRDGPVVGTAVIAGGALATLVVERVIALIVNLSAPSATDFNEFRWVLLSPWGRVGLALGMFTVVVIAVLSWFSSRRAASPWRRALMIGLRTGAASAALVLFLEPAIELRQVAREPNRIAILVDDSRSMELREDPAGPTRIQRAERLLARSRDTLSAWKKDHHLDFYTFSDTLIPTGKNSAATSPARGPATLLRQALEQLRSRYEGRELAGVIVISDGVATGGFAGNAGVGATRDFLRSLDTQVHTAWVGRKGLRDVAIARVLADEFAFVRTVVKVEAVVRSTGIAKQRIPVTISRDGVALRKKWVEIGPGDTDTKVTFELSPPRLGKFVYEIATPVVAGEAVPANNRRSFVLRVIRDKIRVLQVAGRPSWDVRALRSMLKQNPNVDLISFFILRTQDDVSLVPNSEMSLIPFPTRELFKQELPSFDLIVLQNFEYGPYGIGQYLENIRSYVQGGGGLVMLGGELSFASGRYANTPVAEALPVILPRATRPRRSLVDTALFAPKLTRKGHAHPITMLRYEKRDNTKTWNKLPKLEGVNLIGDAKPGASVLAVHPTLKTRSGKPMPVIVAGEYGKGRSLAVTTDSLWRWGFVASGRSSDGGRYYHKLWENSIRWLIQDPELQYLHVDSDKVEYPPGSPVRLSVRLLQRDYTPVTKGTVELDVSRGSDRAHATQVHKKRVAVDGSGEGSVELSGLEPGVYRVRARAKVAGRRVEARDIFLVSEGTAELERPAADSALLAEIAGATGGKFLGATTSLPKSLPFAVPRIIRVDQRSDVELWSRPGLLFLALFLLGLEWLLRQRSGYL